MSVFQPTRDETRAFFFETRRKQRAGEPLAPIEAMAADIVAEHPEYHVVLDDPERYRDRVWTPEAGEANPFLHLGLHLAIAEQVSIDQPPGIRLRYETLCARLGAPMPAQHALIECLAEMIWEVQRYGQPFNVARYLECIDRRMPRRWRRRGFSA
jgi:hypothetical protein